MIRKQILNNIEDEYVTESELIEKLNITEEKLKKNLEKLSLSGYEIIQDSEGYKLVNSPDIIEPYEIKRALKTKYIGKNIHYYEEVDSTNTTAAKFVKEGAPDGTIIIAEHQRAGRSRKRTDWESPKGGIWMTMLLRPNVQLEDAAKLTLVTGVAIAETLHDEFGINAGIKWPNDILIDGRKICGILTEAISDYNKFEAVLIGIGIDVNINKEEFSKEVQACATSVRKETNKVFPRSIIVQTMFKKFEVLYDKFKEGNFKEIVDEWRRLSITTGHRVKVHKNGKAIYADAVGIDNQGALIIEDDKGNLEKIVSGEVIIQE